MMPQCAAHLPRLIAARDIGRVRQDSMPPAAAAAAGCLKVAAVALLLLLLPSCLPAAAAAQSPPPQQQQQRCRLTEHDSTDVVLAPPAFPASFWLVKTIKTGGTTLAGVLRHVAAHYGVVPLNKRRVGPLEALPDAAAAAGLRALLREARNATDARDFALIMHLNFSDAKLAAWRHALAEGTVPGRGPLQQQEQPLLLTAVRHPLARTYSHFIQAKCANAAAALGGKIIQCDTNATFMAKLLELDTVRNRWSFVRSPARHNAMFNYIRGNASSVAAALQHYDFVFVAERMDEALVVFMLLHGLKLQDVAYLPSKNRTGKYRSATAMPRELNDYVLAANQRDLELWQQANVRLDAHVAALQQRCGTEVVRASLATFRHMQAEVARQCSNFAAWYTVHRLPAAQHTYVNDEGWGWRCVRHVAQLFMEGATGSHGGPQAGDLPAVT